MKKAFIKIIVNGKVKESFPLTEADHDWIRAGRLREKAKKGDNKAQKKLEKMEKTYMYREK